MVSTPERETGETEEEIPGDSSTGQQSTEIQSTYLLFRYLVNGSMKPKLV